MNKLLSQRIVTLFKCLAISAFGIGFAIWVLSIDVTASIVYAEDEICYTDFLNEFSLSLPPGWYADPAPLSNTIGGVSVIYNYKPEEVHLDNGKIVSITTNHLKIEVSSGQRLIDQPLEEWLITQIPSVTLDNLQVQAAPQPSSYILGTYEGIAFVAERYDEDILEIILDTGETRVLVITLSPSDSPALSEALSILTTLEISRENNCTKAPSTVSDEQINSLPQDMFQVAPYNFECQLGTFAGDEARNSSIDLQMPFHSNSGEWVVGGNGSFYGNYHHCNYYNNYYATDWNKLTGNDAGYAILPIANGTVSAILAKNCNADPSNRYGCYVQVDHANGFRTLYAYLQDVIVEVGETVQLGKTIGHLGCTGNCVDPHLHLSFWHEEREDLQYQYLSRCYNNGQLCPNGENAMSPQGYRPSPMHTFDGEVIIEDGKLYVSTNGYSIYLPFITRFY